MLEPEHGQQEDTAGQQIQSGRHSSQEVQSQSCRTQKERSTAAAAQPLVLERKSSQSQKHDVIVFLQVLRVMHVSRAKQQRQNAGDGFIDAKTQLARSKRQVRRAVSTLTRMLVL